MDEEQSTGWSEDRMLAAIADVEEKSRRAEQMLSARISRLEKSRGGSLGELEDISSQIGEIAKAVIFAYGAFLLFRFFILWMQQRQQQQQP